MTKTIYGLTVRIDNRQGRYWIFRREPEPIASVELSKLDLRMLSRTAIPHLIPMNTEEMNNEVELRYRVPLGRTLEDYLKSPDGGLRTILLVLHSLTILLEDSRLYMLDETKFVLHGSYIIVGRDAEDIHVAYLPLRSIDQKRSVRQELYQLALQMLDWSGVAHETCPLLLDCLKSSLFELTEFKQLLIGLQTDTGILRANKAVQWPADPVAPVPHVRQVPQVSEVSQVHTPLVQSTEPPFPQHMKRPETRVRPTKPSGIDEEDPILHDGDTLRFRGTSNSIASSSAFKLLLLFILLVWGGAAWKPSEGSFLLAGGVSLVAGSSFLWWSSRTASSSETWGDEEDSDPFNMDGPAQAEPKPYHQVSVERKEEVRAFDWSVDKQKLYASTPAQTVFLMQPAETVSLVLETELLNPNVKAYIEYGESGSAKTIELMKERFVYGRSPSETDWVLQDAGVSRVHGELLRKGQEWILRDLGSKNGSRLNGEPLLPNREYPMKDGDRITAAQAEFIFRMA